MTTLQAVNHFQNLAFIIGGWFIGAVIISVFMRGSSKRKTPRPQRRPKV